jgi:5-methylcytosine-specific restriction protein A
MIAKRINTAFNLGAEHIYFFHKGDWYHNLRRFPGILVDRNGYVRFEREQDYLNSPFLQHGTRLHIRNGISSIPDYIKFTEEQKFIINQLSNRNIETNDQAERRPRNIDGIVRNQTLVRKVKRLRNHTCQICNERLQISNNSFYSEVHHIQPLGKPHNGPDIIGNMICVCPNCHKKLDYGFTQIDFENINQLPRHTIDKVFIDYHNANN